MRPWQITVEKETDNIETNLGFSEERYKELQDILQDALDNPKIIRTTDVMTVILSKCENPNECAYVLILLGEQAGFARASRLLIEKGLGNLTK